MIHLGFFNYNQNKYSKPAFGRSDLLKEIKRIPGTPCACCGREVIMEDAVKKAYSKVTKPLIQMIQKGLLDRWKENSLIWEVLDIFSKLHPKESLDQIVKRDEEFLILKKAVVKDILDKNKSDGTDDASRHEILDLYQEIINDSRGELRSASVVVKTFAKFKDLLFGTKKDVFEQFQIYANMYPRKSLSEIVNTPDIAKFHGIKHNFNKIQINNKRKFHLDNIHHLVKKANPIALEEIKNIEKECLNILAYNRDKEAKIYKIKKLYSEFLDNYNCGKIKKKVFKEIEQIPTSYDSVDNFFSFSVRKNSNDFYIINGIIGPFISSYEHIIPRSKKEKPKKDIETLGNGLVFHTKCNKNRGNLPYLELLEYHPELEKNTKKQINFISKAFLKGNFEDYLYCWPIQVTKNLNNYTEGKINQNILSYCEKRLQMLKTKAGYNNINLNREERMQIQILEHYIKKANKKST